MFYSYPTLASTAQVHFQWKQKQHSIQRKGIRWREIHIVHKCSIFIKWPKVVNVFYISFFFIRLFHHNNNKLFDYTKISGFSLWLNNFFSFNSKYTKRCEFCRIFVFTTRIGLFRESMSYIFIWKPLYKWIYRLIYCVRRSIIFEIVWWYVSSICFMFCVSTESEGDSSDIVK